MEYKSLRGVQINVNHCIAAHSGAFSIARLGLYIQNRQVAERACGCVFRSSVNFDVFNGNYLILIKFFVIFLFPSVP